MRHDFILLDWCKELLPDPLSPSLKRELIKLSILATVVGWGYRELSQIRVFTVHVHVKGGCL